MRKKSGRKTRICELFVEECQECGRLSKTNSLYLEEKAKQLLKSQSGILKTTSIADNQNLKSIWLFKTMGEDSST